jgi:hypothetical protein
MIYGSVDRLLMNPPFLLGYVAGRAEKALGPLMRQMPS